MDLRIPPANRLEKLFGDREGQYSIRINDQWRICFEWRESDVYNVEIVDYQLGVDTGVFRGRLGSNWPVQHDIATGLIYGSSLAAWFFAVILLR